MERGRLPAPLLPNSDAMIAQIKADLAAPERRQNLRLFSEMNYVLVPDSQPTQSIHFFNWPGRIGPRRRHFAERPVSAFRPTFPSRAGRSRPARSRSRNGSRTAQHVGGDRHSIIVKPGAGFIWETWLTKLVGGRVAGVERREVQSRLQRAPPGRMDLRRRRRSADVPGAGALRRMPARHGRARHAPRGEAHADSARFIPRPTRLPCRSRPTRTFPAMGQRVRLKSSFVIPANWTTQEKAVLLALKKYGGNRRGQRRLLLHLHHARRAPRQHARPHPQQCRHHQL